MRGEVIDFARGFSVIDDSYNSNPASLLSMARAVAAGRGAGVDERGQRTLVVAGEMLELGADGAELHRAAGREIAALGIDVLWGVRGLARELIAGARAGGMGEAATRFFATTEEAAEALIDEVRPGDLILVKGSRSVRTDKIVTALREQFPVVGDDEPKA
jgi:UDP-N-acetylmuramoyl-tripeptide--D-alanyl-D-alanine ligase